ISSDEEGDRSVESLEVKVPEGWGIPVRSVQGGEQLGRPQRKRTSEATKCVARVERIAGISGGPSRWSIHGVAAESLVFRGGEARNAAEFAPGVQDIFVNAVV